MGQLSKPNPHPGLNFISITSWQQKNKEQVDEYVQAFTEVLLNLEKMWHLFGIFRRIAVVFLSGSIFSIFR